MMPAIREQAVRMATCVYYSRKHGRIRDVLLAVAIGVGLVSVVWFSF